MQPPPPVVVPTPEGNAVRTAAKAIPNFGSVTQSSNVSSTNVTFDTARASFDGTNGRVTITHQDSSTTTLDTTVDSVIHDSTEFPSLIRSGYRHRQVAIKKAGSDDIYAVLGADWKSGDPTDYVGYGFWLKADNFRTPSMRIHEAGTFLDGPELRGNPIVPVSGSAIYRGKSQGYYIAEVGSNQEIPQGSRAWGEFEADATLQADFDAGTIGGFINNVTVIEDAASPGPERQMLYMNNSYSVDYVLTLEATPIGTGQFVGDTSMSSPSRQVASSSGKWGGQLSNRPVSVTDGDPRLVGGTFGGGFTEADGSRLDYIGAFGAAKQ